jgi:hypothetical protein
MRKHWPNRPVLFALGLGLLAFTPATRATEPFDDHLGIRIPRLFLLMRTDVQNDLGLRPEHVVEINRAASALYRKALRLKGKTGAGIVAARRVIDQDEARWVTAHLTPQQALRLDQIDLQWEGAAALLPQSRPLVAKDLDLSADQEKAIAQLVSDSAARRAQGPWSYDAHTSLSRQAIAVLTEKQRSLWIHVLGPPCQFTVSALAANAASEPARPSPGRPPRPAS